MGKKDKYYIVENEEAGLYFTAFLVKGVSTKKEALEKTYEQYGYDFCKKDFKVYGLDEYYRKYNSDGVAVIQ